jgi:geranylgeranyl diphosphate synthase, type II
LRAVVARAPQLARRLRAFERYFNRRFSRGSGTPPRLHAAIRYSALSPGKRLRPLLVLSACEAAGGRWQRALPAAAALECVHAFSLVHDDLPCMDDDDYRRGRPTTHKKYGEAVALLAGDALLAAAFEELATLTRRGVSAARVLASIGVLSRAAGARELIAGQVLDLAAEGRRVAAKAVRAIHVRKTAALLIAALEIGAIVAGASAARRRRLRTVGRALGLAFQIHDDLLNRASSLKRLGKRAGTDDARGKATYPRAVGEARARAAADGLFRRALRGIESLGPSARPLAQLVRATAKRDR